MSGALLLRLEWGEPSLTGFTSTRVGGISRGPYDSLNLGLNTADDPAAVLENRARALSRGGLESDRTVYLRQVHGRNILEAVAGDAGRGGRAWDQGLVDCDAVFTRRRGLPLAVGHADCLAVALADPEAGLLGLAHAGWRGALGRLPAALVRRLVEEGGRAERMKAVLSPCLGPDSLELGEEQHRVLERTFARPLEFSTRLVHGHFLLDLSACVRAQLMEEGLSGAGLKGQDLDTARHPELFFSHRRDKGITGRMLTVVAMDSFLPKSSGGPIKA